MAENNLEGEFILKPTSSNPDTTTSTRSTLTSSENIKDTGKKPKFYTSFCYYPKGVKFQDQESDEEVILLVRQHFITNIPWILGLFLIGVVPPLLFLFVPIFYLIPISSNLLFFATVFYYVILFSFAIMYFTIWYFNVGIVTNKRLIDVDVHNILIRILSEARLNTIQDITITQVGGIRSIFNYGDIDIQTQGFKQNIEFYRVPHPNFIRTLIGNLILNKR